MVDNQRLNSLQATGKSIICNTFLTRLMNDRKDETLLVNMTFSDLTTAGQVQDILMAKLERYIFKPKEGRTKCIDLCCRQKKGSSWRVRCRRGQKGYHLRRRPEHAHKREIWCTTTTWTLASTRWPWLPLQQVSAHLSNGNERTMISISTETIALIRSLIAGKSIRASIS